MAADDRARDSTIALTRFGLGARPGERRAIAEDPRGSVLAQIARKTSAAPTAAEPASPALFLAVHEYLAPLQQGRKPRGTEKAMAAPAVDHPGNNPGPSVYRD